MRPSDTELPGLKAGVRTQYDAGWRPVQRRGARVLAVLAAAIPLLIGPFWPRPLPPLTGDEPHYLMIAISLERDRDFAVRDNYDRGESSRVGLPGLPMPAGNPVASSHSLHYPGTALVALPGWILGGRRLALLGFAGLAILLGREAYLLARVTGARPQHAALAVAAIALTPPLLLLSRQIYPEIPVALVLIHLARRLAEAIRERGRRPLLWWATVAAAAAAGPWFHVRTLLPAAVLLAGILWFARGWGLLPVGAVFASLAVMGVLFREWYGSPLPTAPYRDFPTAGPHPWRALVGLFADAHVGLVFVAPVLVLGVVVAPRLWAAAGPWVGMVALAIALSVAVTARFTFWHGGTSTMGRFWASLLPLGTPLVAAAFQRLRITLSVTAAVSGVTAVYLLWRPDLAYPDDSGQTLLWRRLGWTFLPVIDTPGRAPEAGQASVALCALFLLLVGLLLAALSFKLSRGSPRQPAL